MSRISLIALCLGLVAMCSGVARANLVVNDGFETETPIGCQSAANPTTCTPPPSGWTIAGDGVSIDTAFPNTGNYDIAFGTLPGDSGMLSQSITTTPGQNYTLTFFVENQAGSALDTFTVSLGAFTATLTGDEASFAYIEKTFTVPGAGMEDLVFEGITGNPLATSADWNLDDVSLTLQSPSVPEPSAAALLATALGMGFSLVPPVRRRRENKAGQCGSGSGGRSLNLDLAGALAHGVGIVPCLHVQQRFHLQAERLLDPQRHLCR